MERRGVPLIGRAAGRRHVLLVTPPASSSWRNGSTVLARTLAAAAASDFHYRLLGVRGQVPPGMGSHIEPLFGDGAQHPLVSQARVLARLLRPDRCAVHHFIFAPHPRAVRAVRAALRLSRKASVHTLPSLPRAGADLAELAGFAGVTVALTDATALLLQSSGVDSVRVIRPAVELQPDRPSDLYRQRLALSHPELELADRPLFVYPGDLEFSTGATTFVDAAARVHEQNPDARFVIACRPKTKVTRVARARLQRRAAAHGLSDVLSFLGIVADMPALLASATAVALPVDSLYAKVDTPIVLLEAMALGTPCVVSDLPQLAELGSLGEGVRVVPRRDPERLGTELQLLADNPSRARRLGAGARRTISSHFRPDAMAAAYEDLYRELLA